MTDDDSFELGAPFTRDRLRGFRLKADADRQKVEDEARVAATKAEVDRLKAEADRLKQENEAQKAATQAELDNAAKQKAQLEAEKVELRTQLLKQFNAILQTRDTARGLIVNMSDVLFDTGKYSLRPLAREKLAKVAGIVSGHPGLKLDVEGHTDSVGGDDYNQRLSERRANNVAKALAGMGVPREQMAVSGRGENDNRVPTANGVREPPNGSLRYWRDCCGKSSLWAGSSRIAD